MQVPKRGSSSGIWSAALVLAKLSRGSDRGGGACPRMAWRVFHGVCPAVFVFFLLFADSGMPDVAFLSAGPSGGEAFFFSWWPLSPFNPVEQAENEHERGSLRALYSTLLCPVVVLRHACRPHLLRRLRIAHC